MFKKILIVGAFDRHNYGDLLFPIVAEKVIRSLGHTGVIEFYSTAASNLSKIGGIPTKGFRDLNAIKKDKDTLILMAGGEIFSATWPEIVGYLLPSLINRALLVAAKLVGERLSFSLLAAAFKSRSKLPFVLCQEDFEGQPVVAYNAIGASHAQYASDYVRKLISEKIKKIHYLSVRDDDSLRTVKFLGAHETKLCPDSAILLSRIFKKNELVKKFAVDASSSNLNCKEYFCFQSSQHHAQNHLETIRQQLINLQRATNLKIVLFSIGTAAGHSDHLVARELYSQLKDSHDCELIESKEILDTMSIIANAKIYIGTSLHGAITALSYGVKHIGLQPRSVPKLSGFLATWSHPNLFRVSEYNNIFHSAMEIINTPHEPYYLDHIDKIQNLALNNFKNILSLKA